MYAVQVQCMLLYWSRSFVLSNIIICIMQCAYSCMYVCVGGGRLSGCVLFFSFLCSDCGVCRGHQQVQCRYQVCHNHTRREESGRLVQCSMHVYMYIVRVLCCCALFVCLTLLASFFLPSHLSFKIMYTCIYIYVCMYMH